MAGLPWDVGESLRLVTSIPGSRGSPWWKAPGARYPPPAPPPPPMLGLYLLFRSALPPCLVLWGVKFTLCFVVVVVVFHIFIVILVQALKVSSYTHRATPLPQCGWRQKLLRKELSSSLLEGRAGWAGKSTLHSSVGTG